MLETAKSCLTKDHRPFQILRSRAAHAAQVIAVINAVCAERIYLLTERFVPTSRWEGVLYAPQDNPNYLLLAPEIDEQIVGWCRVFPQDVSPKTCHVADVGIGILKPYREIGIGTALMETAIAWAETRGLEKLTLDTSSSNQRAINLFTKMGFTVTGVRRRQYKLSDEYADQLLMERFL